MGRYFALSVLYYIIQQFEFMQNNLHFVFSSEHLTQRKKYAESAGDCMVLCLILESLLPALNSRHSVLLLQLVLLAQVSVQWPGVSFAHFHTVTSSRRETGRRGPSCTAKLRWRPLRARVPRSVSAGAPCPPPAACVPTPPRSVNTAVPASVLKSLLTCKLYKIG